MPKPLLYRRVWGCPIKFLKYSVLVCIFWCILTASKSWWLSQFFLGGGGGLCKHFSSSVLYISRRLFWVLAGRRFNPPCSRPMALPLKMVDRIGSYDRGCLLMFFVRCLWEWWNLRRRTGYILVPMSGRVHGRQLRDGDRRVRISAVYEQRYLLRLCRLVCLRVCCRLQWTLLREEWQWLHFEVRRTLSVSSSLHWSFFCQRCI